MLKETADELGLTPYIDEFSNPLSKPLDAAFYVNLKDQPGDNPPIYLAVLDDLRTASEKGNEKGNENSNENSNRDEPE